MNMTIDEFCNKHHACSPGRQWALKHCTSMQHAWDTTTRYDWLMWIASCTGVLSKRDLQWIAFRCAKLVEHLMPEQSKQALSIVECWLLGLVSDVELNQARYAAAYAARAAADKQIMSIIREYKPNFSHATC